MNTTILARRISTLLFLAALLAFMGGCANKNSNPAGSGGTGDLPPLANSVASYGDLELPVEMKWDSEKSMAINTESFKGGILHYNGRVDITSLKDFITASMRNNKWRQVGEASYKNVMMAFTKPNKTCMVVLSEGMGGSLGKTNATLYVTVDLGAAKNLNPFGEPAAPAN